MVMSGLSAVVSAFGLPLRILAHKMLSYFPSIVQRLMVFRIFVVLLLLIWVVRWNISANAASALFRVVSLVRAFFAVLPFPHTFAQACQELNVTGDFATASYYIMCPACCVLTLKADADPRCKKTPGCQGKLMVASDTGSGAPRWVIPNFPSLNRTRTLNGLRVCCFTFEFDTMWPIVSLPVYMRGLIRAPPSTN
jgi:hypothetical protein